MTELLVNGKVSTPAPVTVVVAAHHGVPNLPPGYREISRWTDGTGTTTIRCWPFDELSTRLDRSLITAGAITGCCDPETCCEEECGRFGCLAKASASRVETSA